ncbi:hypothetical protein M427DRAFT_399022 [Gonapodya prolifera JEL478]|uniref:Centromere protein S n=1 Tax=Gonapodya prolifera (strain JEL478) TaxID=1344416 RepID=A0A139A7A0_GONPJ|nr:hypothetical protein M427DRAFT_399022 [Gonapodya prolifera JEL478]|eukprot:KXS12335.1 hypothetical protein M427DRAFT_399022 [Gonapodya prolifera JEL478]
MNFRDHDDEDSAVNERLRAALHYMVGKICSNEERILHFSASQQFIAALSELVLTHAAAMATDLEAFAKHAKRSSINQDDVRLTCRRNQDMLRLVNEFANANARRSATGTKPKGTGRGAALGSGARQKIADDVLDLDDDDE